VFLVRLAAVAASIRFARSHLDPLRVRPDLRLPADLSLLAPPCRCRLDHPQVARQALLEVRAQGKRHRAIAWRGHRSCRFASPMTVLGDTIAARRRGSIDRDEYWNVMRDCHRQLVDYTTLLKDSPVRRIELTADGARLELTDGLWVCWDPTESRTVPTLLLNDGVYEVTELLILLTLAASAQCFIDVGANIGWYSLNLARAGCRTVHAFEPLPNA
jgi:hypothetical protein